MSYLLIATQVDMKRTFLIAGIDLTMPPNVYFSH